MLSTAQQDTIYAAITADTALAALALERRDDLIAAAFNAPSDPAFTVWRPSVTKEEIYAGDFNWTAIDDVTDLKWRVWDELFGQGSIQPNKANVRAGIAEVWKGNAAKLAVQEYVLGKCKRVASRVEKLFASGVGSVAVPGDTEVLVLSSLDISNILNVR